jgi:hypothetical protein
MIQVSATIRTSAKGGNTDECIRNAVGQIAYDLAQYGYTILDENRVEVAGRCHKSLVPYRDRK